ncbi:MAG TPA: hypothetical protein VGH65_10790 [Verrucomicrobiaceae bacterium]|jgi:hypothetical protein
MTSTELAESAKRDSAPDETLPDEAKAMWHARKGNWDEAHEIAQEIHTSTGSWIHALLHLIEGDQGNANYWFQKAGKSTRKPSEIEALWMEIAQKILPS